MKAATQSEEVVTWSAYVAAGTLPPHHQVASAVGPCASSDQTRQTGEEGSDNASFLRDQRRIEEGVKGMGVEGDDVSPYEGL